MWPHRFVWLRVCGALLGTQAHLARLGSALARAHLCSGRGRSAARSAQLPPPGPAPRGAHCCCLCLPAAAAAADCGDCSLHAGQPALSSTDPHNCQSKPGGLGTCVQGKCPCDPRKWTQSEFVSAQECLGQEGGGMGVCAHACNGNQPPAPLRTLCCAPALRLQCSSQLRTAAATTRRATTRQAQPLHAQH